jgi:glutamine amidotransferase-like uncharacterized protein
MRKLIFVLLGLVWPILLCSINHARAEDIIILDARGLVNYQDIQSYVEISKELGLTIKIVDYKFINNRESFFEKDGLRKIKVLIFTGGEPYRWFETKGTPGINCKGVKNVLSFIENGGSVITICWCGASLFATDSEFDHHLTGLGLQQEKQYKYRPGAFKQFCGVCAFKGTIRGPQETNKPYPKTRFLPIKMNQENEIVQEAKLPPVIYQLVTGGGSILPEKGQPLDVVGWFPNGTAAIGIVPYGKGRIIMSNPHPNITRERAWKWFKNPNAIFGEYAKQRGWTEEMIAEQLKLLETEGDPDGPEPDWALSKAMLFYAYKKASQ